jgi:hypothetical protein
VNTKEKAAIAKGLAANHEAFVQNVGQWNSHASYRAQTPGLNYWLRKDGVTLDYFKPQWHNGKQMRSGQVIDMAFANSKGAKTFSGLGAHKSARYLQGKSNKVMTPEAYSEMTAQGVYPGIDFRSYYQGQGLRYDFKVAPGADPNQIQLTFKGADKVTAHNHDLQLSTHVGTFAHGKLFAYQFVNGKKSSVAADFADNHGSIGFKLGAYDHSKPLVIDPVVYGSYYGGDSGFDSVTSLSVDANGNVYMTGYTQATDFPLTTGPYFNSLLGFQNCFVARLQGDAYNIDYSAYFGGSGTDYAQFIRVDQFNNVWICGVTSSPDFPGNTKTNTGVGGQTNTFIMRWQASASTILDPLTNPAISMLGNDNGTATTQTIDGFEIVADPNPVSTDPVILCMAGVSDHALPEVVTGTFATGKAYMIRYQYQGGTFSSIAGACQYIGDGLTIDLGGLALDVNGNMYVTGDVGDGQNNYDTSVVGATTFVTTAGVFTNPTNARLLQKNDLFIRKYNINGGLVYSALVGGSGNEFTGGYAWDPSFTEFQTGSCVAVDSAGNAYITGMCNSFDYPRTRGAYGQVFNATQNVVVTEVNTDASQVIYSTNLKVDPGEGSFGQGNIIIPAGISVDQSGRAFVTGNMEVNFVSFPAATNPADPNGFDPGSIQTAASGTDAPVSTTYAFPKTPDMPTSEPWLNVLDPTGSTLLYGTYLGGNLDDAVFAPYCDDFGDVWVMGWTDSGRGFADPTSGNPVNDNGALPAGLITPLAFKASGDAGLNPTGLTIPWAILDPAAVLFTGTGPPFINASFSQDGWLAKFDIGEPIISSVVATPSTVPGGLGATTSTAITLSSAAPPEGASITLTLLDSNYLPTTAASFDANDQNTSMVVTIPGGATTLSSPVTIYTNAVIGPTQVLVRAYYLGNFVVAPVTVVPWLQKFTVTPTTVVGGNPVTGTIVLATNAPAGGVTVQIDTASGLLTPPATVTIPAGQISTAFTIPTGGVDSKSFPSLSANLLGVSIAQSVELDAARINSLSVVPTRVSSLQTITGTLQLNGLPGPNFPAITVFVQGNPAGYSVNPSSLTFTGANNSATFTIQTGYEAATVLRTVEADQPAVGGTDYVAKTLTATFTVDSNALSAFTLTGLNAGTAAPGSTITGNLTIATPADQGGVNINITDNSGGLISYTTPQVIPVGNTTTSFPITVGAHFVGASTLVTITATRGSVSIPQQFTITPSTLTLSLSGGSVLGGSSVTATATIGNPAGPGGVPVTVSFSPPGYCTAVPSTPVILAGQTSVTFQINTIPVLLDQTITVTITAGSVTTQQTLIIQSPHVSSITFTPANVMMRRTTLCRITLTAPAVNDGVHGGELITLSLSGSTATKLISNWASWPSPISVVIPAGKTNFSFTLLAGIVSRPLSVTVTATDPGGNSTSATLTVVRF